MTQPLWLPLARLPLRFCQQQQRSASSSLRCFLGVILVCLFLTTRVPQLRQAPSSSSSATTLSSSSSSSEADNSALESENHHHNERKKFTVAASRRRKEQQHEFQATPTKYDDDDDDDDTDDDGDTSSSSGGGVIILNLLGRLANNLIQLCFANHLVQELNKQDALSSKEQRNRKKKEDYDNWKIVYRPLWQGVFPDQPRVRACFPNSMLHGLSQPTWDDLPYSLKRNAAVFSNVTTKSFWNSMYRRENSQAYLNWRSALEQQQEESNDRSSMTLQHSKFSLTNSKQFTRDLIQQILSSHNSRNRTNSIRLLHLEAFFIHYDWMHDIMPQMEHWTHINPSCCRTVVPDNAVVLHWRDFESEGKDAMHVVSTTSTQQQQVDMVSVYLDILQHYQYLDGHRRPIWIVCPPTSLQKSVGLRRLVRAIENSSSNSSIRVIPDNNNNNNDDDDDDEMNNSPTLRSILNGKINSKYRTSSSSMSSWIQVVTGRDEMDAMCILRQAKVLLLTPGSTFSQFPAIFPHAITIHNPSSSNDGGTKKNNSTKDTTTTATTTTERQVHYPLLRQFQPPVTLKVPHWQYHLVHQTAATTTSSGGGGGGGGSAGSIQQFNVPHKQIQVKGD